MTKTKEAILKCDNYDWIRAGMKRATKSSISELLNDNQPKSCGKGGVFSLVRDEYNKGCTLTVNMTKAGHEREDIMELVHYSLGSGKVVRMKHIALEAEELAALTPLCLKYDIVISDENSQQDPAQENSQNDSEIFSDSPPSYHSKAELHEIMPDGTMVALRGYTELELIGDEIHQTCTTCNFFILLGD